MNTKEISLEILKLATKIPHNKAIMPEIDKNAMLGFSYPKLREVLDEDYETGTLILTKLEAKKYLAGTFVDKVLLCPYCLAYNIIFRDTCSSCFSANITAQQMIHHYKCGYMGTTQEFQQGDSLICPKCLSKLMHIGKDFERPAEVYQCLECSWAGSEPSTAGRCIACDSLIKPNEYISYNIKNYKITKEGELALKTGEIKFHDTIYEELIDPENIRSHFSKLIPLMALTDVFGSLSNRYKTELYGISIIADVISTHLKTGIDNFNEIKETISPKLTLETNSVIELKAHALLHSISEKILHLTRDTDYLAIYDNSTIFGIFYHLDIRNIKILAKKILKTISSLSFSGEFKKTTLSIGIVKWEKKFTAKHLLYESNKIAHDALEAGGNRILIK